MQKTQSLEHSIAFCFQLLSNTCLFSPGFLKEMSVFLKKTPLCNFKVVANQPLSRQNIFKPHIRV